MGPNVVLVTGSDRFLVEEEAEGVLDSIAPDWRENEFKVQRVSGLADKVDDAVAAIAAARAALDQPGFFASDPVVWLRDLSFSQAPQSKDRVSNSPQVQDALREFAEKLEAEGVPEGVTLLVTSVSIGKATRFYKFFDRLAKANPPRAKIDEIRGGTKDAAGRLVDRKLAERGWTMSPAARSAFLERVGCEGSVVVRELEKLFAYTGGREPAPEDVAQICTLAQGGVVFELQDAFGRRDLAACMRVVDGLLAGAKESAVVGFFFMLESRLNDIALVVDAREHGQLGEDGRTWSRSLSPDDASAVRTLGKADVLSKPSFLKAPVVEQSRRWTPRQCMAARAALMHGHERATSSGFSPRLILDTALAAALR
ncbi:MAG: hypothetical protein IJ783_09060 [Kiritimatiellae bacterium]|nr:hypothetical protein [Kiritimatiellia bacterium]